MLTLLCILSFFAAVDVVCGPGMLEILGVEKPGGGLVLLSGVVKPGGVLS